MEVAHRISPHSVEPGVFHRPVTGFFAGDPSESAGTLPKPDALLEPLLPSLAR